MSSRPLREWGITVDQTFFLGGMDKSRILKIFRPHIFFDDQQLHLDGAVEVVPVRARPGRPLKPAPDGSRERSSGAHDSPH